jgi:hypothetical protein
MSTPIDPLELRFAALARVDDDSDWAGVRRRRSRPALAVAFGVLLLATLGAGAAFGLYDDVLPFESQPPAPEPVVKDFQSLFGGEYAPPGMDPHVVAGETRRVATYRNGRHRYVLYVAPTKTGGFCESFVRLFGGCRQTRSLPPGAPTGVPGDTNSYAIGLMGDMTPAGATILGGDLLLPPGTTLSVEFADRTTVQIPVTYVSPPIDAGFFLYPVPSEHVRAGHQAISLTARNRDGEVVAKALVLPARAPGPASRS